MTDDDKTRLAEIREREKAATAGPWQDACGSVTDWHDGMHTMEFIDNRTPSREQRNRDISFIAAARSDIPWLIARLEKAWAEVERVKKEPPVSQNCHCEECEAVRNSLGIKAN